MTEIVFPAVFVFKKRNVFLWPNLLNMIDYWIGGLIFGRFNKTAFFLLNVLILLIPSAEEIKRVAKATKLLLCGQHFLIDLILNFSHECTVENLYLEVLSTN